MFIDRLEDYEMKKLIIGGAAIAVLGYLGVVGYLHKFDKENATQLLMENRYTGEQEKVAKALFDNSCQYCHSPNTPLPFYSKFPIVGDEMQSDIQSGLRAFRLDRLLEGLKDPSKLSQADLAKLQRVLENNEMPIAIFTGEVNQMSKKKWHCLTGFVKHVKCLYQKKPPMLMPIV